ncbi:hypothetical protein EV714DRAFT_217638 [Schizophyllum commune]
MSGFFWNDYDASNNAFTRMEARLKENRPEGDNTLSRQSSASNTDAQHGDGKMALSLQASPGRAQPGRRALSRSANSLFLLNHLQGLQREPSFENIGVAPVDTWSLGIPVETSLSELSSSEDEDEDDDDDEPVAPPPPPPPPPPRARGGRKRGGAPRKGAGGRKARVQEDAEDSEDDAAATATSLPKTARSSGRTRGSASTRGRAASTRGRAASTRGRAASTRGRASTARAPVASRTGPARSAARQAAVQAAARPTQEESDKFFAETRELIRRGEEEYATMQAQIDALARADSEDDTDTDTDTESVASAVSVVASVAPAVQVTRTVTDDTANFTPSPSRTPPATTSAPEPASIPSATSESAATSRQQTSIDEGKERAVEAQPEVEERANTPASPPSAPAPLYHGPREESAQQIANAPTPSTPTTWAVHYASPAVAQNPPPAPVQNLPPAHAHPAPRAPAQNQPAAPLPWSYQAAPMAHPPTQFTNTPMDGMPAVPPAHVHRQPHPHRHYRLPAPSYHPQPAPVHYRQHVAPTQSSYAAAPPTYPHATVVDAQPMGSTMLHIPQPTMPAPPVQNQAIVQASAASHGSARSNKRPWSSTQEPWTGSYASAAAPASAHAQGTMGAYAGSPMHSSMPASLGTSLGSARAQYSTYTGANDVARDIVRLPRTAATHSATIRPAYTPAYGSPVGVMAHPRVVHADAVPPTLREAAYLLHELMDGRAVLSEQLCEQIVQCHSVLRERLEKAKDLAPKTPAHLLPPTYEGMKLLGEPVEPGKMHWACRWPHQGLSDRICGWAFVIDPDELDDSKNRTALFSQICNHFGHDIHASVDCQWGGGCGRGQVYQNIGGHIGQHHIFEYIRDAKRARLA